MAAIYRVTKKTTGSLQPGSGSTFWNRTVLYCGTDLTEARIAYLASVPTDFGGGYGNRCQTTEIEEFEAEPEEIDSTTGEPVEVDDE